MLELIDLPATTAVRPDYDESRSIVRDAYARLDETSRNKRARELATILGLTEAQWVAAQCEVIRSIPLAGSPAEIFSHVGRLGEAMALTRNDFCVHERHGQYLHIKADSPVGLVLGPDIDLRMFFSSWTHVWAVEEKGRCSLQFFDNAGVAVHKIYCTGKTNMSEYVALVREFASDEPVWPIAQPSVPDLATDCVEDVPALRAAWLAMGDTHEFFPLLRRFNVKRIAAVRAVGPDLAQPVATDAVETMLPAVARSGLSIMCFVANQGMVQIHTGPVNRIQRTGSWLNILDPAFNLHLDVTQVASTWVVNKPSRDGWITSLELYADSGELIVQFFGARKPGSPELTEWRALLAGMCREPLAK